MFKFWLKKLFSFGLGRSGSDQSADLEFSGDYNLRIKRKSVGGSIFARLRPAKPKTKRIIIEAAAALSVSGSHLTKKRFLKEDQADTNFTFSAEIIFRKSKAALIREDEEIIAILSAA